MATGDFQGNLDRLRAQLRSVGYRHPIDFQGLKLGLPTAILPLLHHAFLGYSKHVAKYLSTHGYELYAKSDLRFMECILRFLRFEFGYRCPLTVAQIFSRGFAERKVLFVHDVTLYCKRKHNELLKASRGVSPAKKLKVIGGPAKFWRHIKVKRSTDLRDEDVYATRKGYELHIQKAPSSSKSEDGHENASTVLIGGREKNPGKLLSPTCFDCPPTGLQLCLNEEGDESKAYRSPKARSRPTSHFARVLVNSSPPRPVSPGSEGNTLQHLRADSSLPRKLDTTGPEGADASIPRRQRSRSTSPSLRTTGTSPKKCEINMSGMMKSSSSTSKEDEHVCSVRRSSPERPPKPSSPRLLDAALFMNTEVFALCYGELNNKIDEIAVKLETRFGTIERSLSKSTKQMEGKFSSLENRIELLEKAFSAHGLDLNTHHGKIRSHSPEKPRMPSPVQAIRDISNLQQNSPYCPRSPTCVYTQPHSHLRGNLTTQELIASIKARCNRTRELLSESRRFH